MASIAYVIRSMAGRGIAVTAVEGYTTRWECVYRGYRLEFCVAKDSTELCSYSARKARIPGAYAEYRDNLSALLRMVDYLTRDGEDPNLPAPGRPNNESDEEHAKNPVNPIPAAELGTPVAAFLSDPAAPAQTAADAARELAAYPSAGRRSCSAGSPARLLPPVAVAVVPVAVTTSYRVVALTEDGEPVHSGAGWTLDAAVMQFFNGNGKLDTLSGKAAASVVGLAYVEITHGADGTTEGDAQETDPELLEAFADAMRPRVEAWRELQRATAAFAILPDDANARWIPTAAEAYRAAFFVPVVNPN